MPFSRAHRISRSGRPRRPMDWEFAQATIGAMGPGSVISFQVVTSTELNAEYTDPTLMATRLVSAVTFAASAVGAAAVVGLIAWDDLNNTPPVGADAPGPIRNGNLDWIIRQVFLNPSGAAGTGQIQPGDETVTSKARRRLGSSRTILACVETNNVASLTQTIIDARCLIKE